MVNDETERGREHRYYRREKGEERGVVETVGCNTNTLKESTLSVEDFEPQRLSHFGVRQFRAEPRQTKQSQAHDTQCGICFARYPTESVSQALFDAK